MKIRVTRTEHTVYVKYFEAKDKEEALRMAKETDYSMWEDLVLTAEVMNSPTYEVDEE